MRKLLYTLILLIGFTSQAQTFNFECDHYFVGSHNGVTITINSNFTEIILSHPDKDVYFDIHSDRPNVAEGIYNFQNRENNDLEYVLDTNLRQFSARTSNPEKFRGTLLLDDLDNDSLRGVVSLYDLHRQFVPPPGISYTIPVDLTTGIGTFDRTFTLPGIGGDDRSVTINPTSSNQYSEFAGPKFTSITFGRDANGVITRADICFDFTSGGQWTCKAFTGTQDDILIEIANIMAYARGSREDLRFNTKYYSNVGDFGRLQMYTRGALAFSRPNHSDQRYTNASLVRTGSGVLELHATQSVQDIPNRGGTLIVIASTPAGEIIRANPRDVIKAGEEIRELNLTIWSKGTEFTPFFGYETEHFTRDDRTNVQNTTIVDLNPIGSIITLPRYVHALDSYGHFVNEWRRDRYNNRVNLRRQAFTGEVGSWYAVNTDGQIAIFKYTQVEDLQPAANFYFEGDEFPINGNTKIWKIKALDGVDKAINIGLMNWKSATNNYFKYVSHAGQCGYNYGSEFDRAAGTVYDYIPDTSHSSIFLDVNCGDYTAALMRFAHGGRGFWLVDRRGTRLHPVWFVEDIGGWGGGGNDFHIYAGTTIRVTNPVRTLFN